MRNKLYKHWQYLILFCLLLLSGLALILTPPRIENIEVRLPSGKIRQTIDLYNSYPQEKGMHIIRADIIFPPFSQRIFVIQPDDCLYSLKLNGKPVKLSHAPLCYGDSAPAMNLSGYRKMGINRLEAMVENKSGPFGLYIRSSITDPYVALFAVSGIASFIGLAWISLKKIMKFEPSTIAIIIGSFLIRFWYVSYTAFTVREHDVWAHIQYMAIIARMFMLPSADACYECHQQPLYYLLSAFTVGITRLVGVYDYYTILQLGNVLTFFALIVIVALLFRHVFDDVFLLNLAVALFAFWPSGIIDSARIGNDVPLYTGYCLAFYFLYRYVNEKGWSANRYLLLSLITAGVTAFVKISAIAALPLIIGAYLYKHFRQGFNRNLLIYLVVSSFIILSLSFIPYFLQNNKRSFFSRITRSDQIGKVLKTGNGLANYTYFDQSIFLGIPFTSPVDDRGGRQYIWNYVLKSSLFGEYQFNNVVLYLAGLGISYLGLAFFMYAFTGVLFVKPRDSKQLMLFLMNMVVLLAMFLYYRSHFPSASNTDFRYMFPVILSVIYFFVYSIKRFKEQGIWQLAFFGCVLAMAFVILTQYFFIIIPMTG